MVEKDRIIEQKVAYDGIFDFKETYSFLYTLLIDGEYIVEEKSYSEKSKPDSKEIEVSWDAKRKVTDYVRYHLKISWRILGLKEIEVMRDGKKIKANSGKLEIKIAGFLETDYENKWEATAFFRFLRGVYDKFIINTTLEKYEDGLFEEVEESVNQMKTFLVLEAKR